jgi:hypothetical protein
MNRGETIEALNSLEQSSLWLSAKIYQEARQAFEVIFLKDQ